MYSWASQTKVERSRNFLTQTFKHAVHLLMVLPHLFPFVPLLEERVPLYIILDSQERYEFAVIVGPITRVKRRGEVETFAVGGLTCERG